MNVKEAIDKRKSIRKYLDKPVDEKDLLCVLQAGQNAPSARNLQGWKFIVVNDREKNQALMEACCSQKMVGEAPVNIVVLGEGTRTMKIGQDAVPMDGAIAMSFMMLQASELGLSTCWLGSVIPEKVKALLEVPENWNVIAVSPLGYAAEDGRDRSRKELSEVVSYNKF